MGWTMLWLSSRTELELERRFRDAVVYMPWQRPPRSELCLPGWGSNGQGKERRLQRQNPKCEWQKPRHSGRLHRDGVWQFEPAKEVRRRHSCQVQQFRERRPGGSRGSHPEGVIGRATCEERFCAVWL